MADGYYIYAIASGERILPIGVTGIGGGALSLVRCGGLAAIVSRVDADRIRPTATNVLRHESVVEELRQAMPLLPVRFGTVLPDAAAVVRRLDERYPVLESDLARLGDTFEFGLLVRWNPPDVGEPASVARRETVTIPASAADQAGHGRRYLQARLADHQHAAALRAQAERLAREIDASFAAYAVDHRRALLPTPQLAVRSTYLVEHARIDAFREAFDHVRRRRPELSFLLSGPWPPYSFVTHPESGAESTLRSWLQLLSQNAP